MKRMIALLIPLCAAVAAFGQQPTPSTANPVAPGPCCVRRTPKRVVTAPPASGPTRTIPAATDFFVGAAKVDVTKDETVVRLAMAQHGSVLIELPANDGPRYIIPGDPEMATVDEKALERNKRAIVVRPGSLFVAPSLHHKTRTPAATVTAQMRSGLVVTFLFYPVEDLAQNVHRCVLSYNRDEVVARRRAAGLPVNLDNSSSQERRIETGQSTAPTSISVAGDENNPVEDSAKPTGQGQVDQPAKEDAKQTAVPTTAVTPTAATTEPNPVEKNPKIKTTTQEALALVIMKPKQFKKWTKAVHNISVAVLDHSDPKESFRIAVVAVKNTGSDALKITPGSPDLSLEMFDDQGKPVNIQSIKRLHVETSNSSDVIAAGATIYYAIAYAAPVLGAHQYLKMAVSQASAADEPVSLTLAGKTR